jgi:HAD superfamily hydrolase (TIGR01509 family)
VTERFDLVIFDCDGVLVDSERLSIRLDVELLAALGWPMAEDEVVERWVGRTEAAMRAEIEEHLGRSVEAEWAAFSERYVEAFAAELEPVDGVADAVDAVQAAGLATCVASSGDLGKIRRNLAKTGLLHRFDGRLFSADDVEHGKPAPDLFLHAAERMGFAPAGCVVIEDSAYGVEAGVAAGMRVLGYGGGMAPEDSLRAAGAEVFGHMSEVPGLLGLTDRGERTPQ